MDGASIQRSALSTVGGELWSGKLGMIRFGRETLFGFTAWFTGAQGRADALMLNA